MRSRPLLLTLAVTTLSSAGCAPDATAPDAFVSRSRPVASHTIDLDGGRGRAGTKHDGASYVFTIDPRTANVLYMGAHRLELPANSVCALDESGYGTASWDAPCAPETNSVTITARVRDEPGEYPRVDFEPEMRFNPETNVYLSLFMKSMAKPQPLAWRVLYCATSTTDVCLDEAAIDPDLATLSNRQSTVATRRIKHFSGYMVAE
jgi:hypothetical protein